MLLARPELSAVSASPTASPKLVPDRRDPSRVTDRLADMIRARLFAICCSYERWCTRSGVERHPIFEGT